MIVEKHSELPLRAQEDVVAARQLVRAWSVELGLSLVDQTKIITAVRQAAMIASCTTPSIEARTKIDWSAKGVICSAAGTSVLI